MASWKEERDRLVAQTLAFVQQVAAAHPAAVHKFGLRAPPDPAPGELGGDAPLPETSDVTRVAIGEPSAEAMTTVPASDDLPPADILADLPPHQSRYSTASERSDISSRVAAFKARQMTLNREREAFYEIMQARIRSALRNDTGKAPL